jgi:hypothetical protein
MRILRQLVREFWLPFLAGLIWTSQRVQWSQPDLLASIIANFTASFFFTSWAVGHVMRIKRQQTVEDSLKNVETRLVELRDRMSSLSAVSNELQVQAKDVPNLQPSVQNISTLAAAVDTELAAANTAMSNVLSSYIRAVEEPELLKFVWHSTPTSVAAGYFSLMACLEVVVTVVVYWIIVVAIQTPSFYFVVGLLAVPFLLLRSDESVALGVRWAERYVDVGITDISAKPLSVWSPRFLLSVSLGLIGGGIGAYLIGSLVSVQSDGMVAAAKIVLTAYLAAQVGAGITIAIEPRYLGTVAGNRLLLVAAIVGGALSIALGATVAGAPLQLASIAIAVVGILGLGTFLEAPQTVEFLRAKRAQAGKLDSLEAVGESFGSAPRTFSSFALAVFAGGWLRTVAIRFAATAMHLRAGFRALPDNWWRTLFVIDIFHPPELVPGYRRPDFFNLPHLVERLRDSQRLSEKYFNVVGALVLYVPAYVYRFVIKSTCWVYMPLIYVVRQPALLTRPELVHVLWNDPREWWRRFLMIVTLAGYFIYNFGQTTIPLPPHVSEVLKYIFVIDGGVPKSWQIFNLTSAFITFVLFMNAGRLKMGAPADVRGTSVAVEYLMRVRNISTGLLLCIVVAHAVAWLTPISSYLPNRIVEALRSL